MDKSHTETPDGWLIYHRDDAGCPEAHTDGDWYYQPDDYDGDVYSPGYPTRTAALSALLAHDSGSDPDRELAQRIFDAADEGGIIQAWDMVGLVGDPTMHSTQRMWRVADHCGPGVHAALADICGFDPADDDDENY